MTESTTRKRLDIGPSSTMMDLLVQMSEGNPGALTALMEIIKSEGDLAFTTILHLDDMNMRGPMIWLGYKDVCDHDVKLFVEKIVKRDQAMVDQINQINRGYNGHYAMTGGASYKHI